MNIESLFFEPISNVWPTLTNQHSYELNAQYLINNDIKYNWRYLKISNKLRTYNCIC